VVANLAAADAVVPVGDLPSYLVMSFGRAELTVDGLWLPGHGVAIVSV
jgi:maltooligosyltrehalose trehalohydrolase